VTDASFGQLISVEDRPVLEFRRRLAHPRETVWEALTDPGQLAAWFPTSIDGECAAGGALTFRFEHVEAAPMHGEMLRCERPSLLEFTWGGDVLRFALEPDGDGTAMTFTVVLEELGKATRDGAGWHQCLEELDRALVGEQTRDHEPRRWRELRDAYAGRFGPDASVLGPPQEWDDEYVSPDHR
jgi:uncharacterized protein YndB with AHSA1/START domain